MLHVFGLVLHDVSRVLKRDDPAKQAQLAVESTQVLFIFSGTKADAHIGVDRHADLLMQVFPDEIPNRGKQCLTVVIVVVHHLAGGAVCGKPQRADRVDVVMPVKPFGPTESFDDFIDKDRRRFMGDRTSKGYPAEGFKPLGIRKGHTRQPGTVSARVDAQDQPPPVAVIVVLAVKIRRSGKGIGIVPKGIHDVDAFRKGSTVFNPRIEINDLFSKSGLVWSVLLHAYFSFITSESQAWSFSVNLRFNSASSSSSCIWMCCLTVEM